VQLGGGGLGTMDMGSGRWQGAGGHSSVFTHSPALSPGHHNIAPPAPHMDACGAREQCSISAPGGQNARGVCELSAALRDVAWRRRACGRKLTVKVMIL